MVNGQYKFLINGHHFENPKLPYIHQVRNGVDIGKNSKQVYSITEGQTVDIVFQNRVMTDGPCIQVRKFIAAENLIYFITKLA